MIPTFTMLTCVRFVFALTEKSSKHTASSGTDGEVHRPDPTLEEDSASESLGENSCVPASRGVSSVLSSAASEGELGGGCEGRGGGGVCGLEFSRPGSETYLTASDDSSSLFDDDMQRAERSGFGVLGSSEGTLGGCKEEEKEAHRAKVEDCSSEELNKRFQSQRLDSSSSSSEPNTPSPILTALTPKRPNPPQDLRDNPASPKQPRLRTPAGLGLMNMSLAKKHLSQPPISSEAAYGQTRNALSMLRLLRPQETDLDQEQEAVMETGRDTPPQVQPSSQALPPVSSLQTSPGSPEPGAESSPEGQDCEGPAPGNKPPTPPLHRLPSWVS